MNRDALRTDKEKWVGFDLDGTLAEYDGWKGIDHIGKPIQPMVDMLLKLHNAGVKVKIFTARADPKRENETKPSPFYIPGSQWQPRHPELWRPKRFEKGTLSGNKDWTAADFVRLWCLDNLGFTPEVTNAKDGAMICCFDDRAVQVEPNTGKIVGALIDEVKLAQTPAEDEAGPFSPACFLNYLSGEKSENKKNK